MRRETEQHLLKRSRIIAGGEFDRELIVIVVPFGRFRWRRVVEQYPRLRGEAVLGLRQEKARLAQQGGRRRK